MRVIMFQPRFHEAIRIGTKRSTIRLNARCKPGDTLSLRKWSGRPYEKDKPQIVLCEHECKSVTPIRLVVSSTLKLHVMAVWQPTQPVVFNEARLQQLAIKEGFRSVEDMRDWFILNHDLSPDHDVTGALIEW